MVDELRLDQKLIMVPHDARTLQLSQESDDRLWTWPQCGDIAETDDLIYTNALDISQHRAQAKLVRMDIGDQCNAHFVHRLVCCRTLIVGAIKPKLRTSTHRRDTRD